MRLQRERVENYSGFDPNWEQLLPVIKRDHYIVVPRKSLGGDQPKDLIRIYKYGEGWRSNPVNWPTYIAKFGMKWYAMESVTEYLLNRLGEEFGMNMAESELVYIHGQVRFLSRYFLNPKTERLVHGAEIYSNHLNDTAFVQEVEDNKLENRFFSYEFALQAIQATFPSNCDHLCAEFTHMLMFDALIGAMDRHFYNWGVVTDVTGRTTPRYAPIYDTARGLFWNSSEQSLKAIYSDRSRYRPYLKKYCDQSRPKVGSEGMDNVNHFKFVEVVLNDHPVHFDFCNRLFSIDNLSKAMNLLDREFVDLMSPVRLTMIKSCLEERFNRLAEIMH